MRCSSILHRLVKMRCSSIVNSTITYACVSILCFKKFYIKQYILDL